MQQFCLPIPGWVLFAICGAFVAYLQFVVIHFLKQEIREYRARVHSWERYFDELKAEGPQADPPAKV